MAQSDLGWGHHVDDDDALIRRATPELMVGDPPP
jgi:hypothetical protein